MSPGAFPPGRFPAAEKPERSNLEYRHAAAITANVPHHGGHPAATFTPLPTFTPRPTPLSPPRLALRLPWSPASRFAIQTSCLPLLQVEIYDKSNVPIFGTPITVTWDGGTNTFYTGLFPQINEGYADFQMTPDMVYVLQAGLGGQQVGNLQAPQCIKPDGSTYWGGWKLSFKQP